MRKPNMKRIVTLLRQLSPSQLKAVAVEMAALETRSGASGAHRRSRHRRRSCPHCRSERYVGTVKRMVCSAIVVSNVSGRLTP